MHWHVYLFDEHGGGARAIYRVDTLVEVHAMRERWRDAEPDWRMSTAVECRETDCPPGNTAPLRSIS